MTTQYKDFIIEIFNDDVYTPNSADNITRYKYVYPEDTYFIVPSKYGIRIFKDEIEISSAIIFGNGGGMRIQLNSFIVKNNVIFICCGDHVYSLGIPELNVIWSKKIDPATCFGIYQFESDFIIHGELEISRITQLEKSYGNLAEGIFL
jgi:hypothetical protein